MTSIRNHDAVSAACCAVAFALLLMTPTTIGCSDPTTPTGPSAQQADVVAHSPESDGHAGAMDSGDKGYIDGWFQGQEVSLHYTKSYFCASPPPSLAETPCVVGAPPEIVPRPGPIRTIYALAAVGFAPPPETLACRPGTPCLNHPLMIDASRVAGPNAGNIRGLPHSHIVDERGAGWFHTVNIRVFNREVWDQIVEAKSLAKVRALQADPAVGGAGLIDRRDNQTNIFFFIASWS